MRIKKISFYITLVATVLVVILNGLYGGGHFDGADIIAIIMILLTPIKNLYSLKIKTINNKLYYYLLTLISIYILVVSICALYIYIIKLPIEANNESALLFFNNLPIMYLLIIILTIVSSFSKKTIFKSDKDNYRITYLIVSLAITSEILVRDSMDVFSLPIIISLAIFYFIIFAKNIEQYDTKELNKVYIITSIMLTLTSVFTPIMLIYGLYDNLRYRNKLEL